MDKLIVTYPPQLAHVMSPVRSGCLIVSTDMDDKPVRIAGCAATTDLDPSRAVNSCNEINQQQYEGRIITVPFTTVAAARGSVMYNRESSHFAAMERQLSPDNVLEAVIAANYRSGLISTPHADHQRVGLDSGPLYEAWAMDEVASATIAGTIDCNATAVAHML